MLSFETQHLAVAIPLGPVELPGQLQMPPQARGLVLFAHGSGSTRHSPRNQRVAECLHEIGFATLLFDLRAPEEEAERAFNPRLRFDVELLAKRLRAATRWARENPDTAEFQFGYFGAGTGGAAALAAAAEGPRISAVVTRGAPTGIAGPALREITAPTMLIAGSNDTDVARANLETWARLTCEKSIEIIPGAGRLFEEPGALDIVTSLTARWFGDHLQQDSAPA